MINAMNKKNGNLVDRTAHSLSSAAMASMGNERGMALVLALVMLALLGILGAWVLDTSNTDLKISGNFRTTQNAFYAADGGIGYTTNRSTLLAVQNIGTSWSSPTINISSSGSTTASFTTRVPSLLEGPLPQSGAASTIYDVDVSTGGWHGLYSGVTSTGVAANNAVVVVEAVVATAVPN
jgi:hypothetical protein